MPQEGAPRLLHERIAAGRAAVVAAARRRRSTRAGLPDPELTAHMLSAYADEAARLVLDGHDIGADPSAHALGARAALAPS